jgi:hypothetical protein
VGGALRETTRRRLLRLEITTMVVAAVVPALLWNRNATATLGAFQWDVGYFAGLLPMILMALGLVCYLPVVRYRARPADHRFYEAEPHAWQGWAVVLYVLGFCLATQTAQLAHGAHP